MAEMTPAGWDGILAPDEHILWQGRPDGRFRVTGAHVAMGLFGLAFAGFALLWMALASRAGGFFWAFGLLHLTVGLGMAVVPPVGGMILRRRSWYTLTNRRAFVATDMPLTGRRLADYPITPDTPITLTPTTPPGVHFARATRPQRRHRRRRGRSISTPVGFDYIEDAAEVAALMRQIQSDPSAPNQGPHP